MDNLLETLNTRIEQLLVAMNEKDAAIARLNNELQAALQQTEQHAQATSDLHNRLDAQNTQLTELLTRMDGALNTDPADQAAHAADSRGKKAEQNNDRLDVDLG